MWTRLNYGIFWKMGVIQTSDTNNKIPLPKKTKMILSLNNGRIKEIIIINQVIT